MSPLLAKYKMGFKIHHHYWTQSVVSMAMAAMAKAAMAQSAMTLSCINKFVMKIVHTKIFHLEN